MQRQPSEGLLLYSTIVDSGSRFITHATFSYSVKSTFSSHHGITETLVCSDKHGRYIHKYKKELYLKYQSYKIYLLTRWCGLRGLPSWRSMPSAAEHHRHAGRCSSTVGAE